MRESRVIALAGVMQACRLVHEIAANGRTSQTGVESSLASVFRIDAESAAAVFGGVGGVRVGLEALLAQFEGERREPALTRLVLGVLRLERRLARNPRVNSEVGEGIGQIQRQVEHFGVAHATVQARLADLYGATLSRLVRPVSLSAGYLRAEDERTETLHTFALHRITAAVVEE
jgi:high frequency lysogenization protein